MARILHLVKTTHGAAWALKQATHLVQKNYDVHVMLPDNQGPFYQRWIDSGCKVHIRKLSELSLLCSQIKPDIIHSHFFISSVAARHYLGNSSIPRIFQIPGPLHLEHRLFRNADVLTANENDYWIASSKAIDRLLHQAGVPIQKRFISYYGSDYDAFKPAPPSDNKVFTWGNINYMYPPKRYLFQREGLKRHELLIRAAQVLHGEFPFEALFVGGQFGSGKDYELSIRKMAEGCSSIKLPGKVSDTSVASLWEKFDLAVHTPASENCGGVVEPLLCGVPVLAADVGGLPEVIVDGVTGWIIRDLSAHGIADAIRAAHRDLPRLRQMAKVGEQLVREMFDYRRTADEVSAIYQHILNKSARPNSYDSVTRALELKRETP